MCKIINRLLVGVLSVSILFATEINVFAEANTPDVSFNNEGMILTEQNEKESLSDVSQNDFFETEEDAFTKDSNIGDVSVDIQNALVNLESFAFGNEITGYAVPFTAEEMAAYQARISKKDSEELKKGLLNSAERNNVQQGPTEEEVYQRMMALKPSYPEGMPWTNANGYEWNGGIWSTGYGCAGFTFILSDAAFGDLPARRIFNITIADVRVGDILRVNGNTHSVIITEVYNDYVVLAEGNYNSSIHWGRIMSAAEVATSDYLVTRYPITETIYDSGDGFRYIFNGQDSLKIMSCYLTGDIVIPKKINGYTVKSLGPRLFYDESTVTSVTLPATIEEIGYFDYVFSYCTNLSKIEVSEENQNYSSYDGVLYTKDKKTLIAYPCAKMGVTYSTFPETTYLCCTSFARQHYLKSLILTNENCSWAEETFFDTPVLTVFYLPGFISEITAKEHIEKKLCRKNNPYYPVFKEGKSDPNEGIISNDFPKEYLIKINEVISMDVYEFVPDTTGEYLFFSEGTGDSIVLIYDRLGNLLGQDDDSGEDYNFSCQISLEGGQKYYLKFSAYGNATYTVNVNRISYFEPCFVENLTAIPTATGVKLNWNKCDDENLLYVCYVREEYSEWSLQFQTNVCGAEFIGVKSGKTYEFVVLAADSLTNLPDINSFSSEIYKHEVILLYCSQPKLSSISAVSGGVQIMWNGCDGAPNYRVFRKTEGGSWYGLANTKSTSYVDKTAKAGTKYWYTVRCISEDGKMYLSSFDDKGLDISYKASDFGKPKVSVVSNVSNGVQVKWGKIDGAPLYRVFRKTSSSGWRGIANTNSTSYTDTTAKSGTKYWYTVRIMSADGKSHLSDYDSAGVAVTFYSQPKLAGVAKVAAGIQVKWGKVNGMPNYAVFRKSVGTNWSRVGTTTGTSFVDTTAKTNTQYWYTVRGISVDGKTYLSSYDTAGLSITCYGQPKLGSVKAISSGVQVKWEAVSKATNYRVFRKIEGGSWIGIGNTTSDYFIDRTAVKGTRYWYTVRIISADGKTYLSSYDENGLSIKY